MVKWTSRYGPNVKFWVRLPVRLLEEDHATKRIGGNHSSSGVRNNSLSTAGAMVNRSQLFDKVSMLFKKVPGTELWEFDVPAAYEEVRLRAYYKWEQAGKPEGRDDEFWFDSEKEVSDMAREIDHIWFTDP